MDAKLRASLLGRWEATVRGQTDLANQIGPPSWLVLEDWRGEAKEPFMEAHRRVRLRYGLLPSNPVALGPPRPDLPPFVPGNALPRSVTEQPQTVTETQKALPSVTNTVTRPMTPAEKQRAYRDRQKNGRP